MGGGRGGGQIGTGDGEVNRCVVMMDTWGLEWLLILIEDPSDTEEDKGQVSQGLGGLYMQVSGHRCVVIIIHYRFFIVSVVEGKCREAW